MQDKDGGGAKANNPFLAMSPTAESKTSPTADKSQGLLDFFNDSHDSTPISTNRALPTGPPHAGKASDDLLFLTSANPFADILNAAISNAPPMTQTPFGTSMAPVMGQPPQQQSMGQPSMVPRIQSTGPFNGMPTNGGNMFASEDGFAAAFGKSDTTSASGMPLVRSVVSLSVCLLTIYYSIY
jgi:hypothetical protein